MSLFSQRRKRPSIELTRLSSLIAEDVVITGDLCFSSGIRIDGCINGNVTVRGGDQPGHALVVVSEKGRIQGSLHCADAVINGTVEGNLQIEHFLHLQSESRITGTVRYRHLQMDVGAVVRGELLDEQAAPAPGNVVSLPAEKAQVAERR